MSDSIKSYEESAVKELNQLQGKYAGQPRVMCATSVGDDVFDFSKVTKDDIVFGVHGSNYIVAKARHIKTEEIRKCYLKYVNKYATLLQMSDESVDEFWSRYYKTVRNRKEESEPVDIQKNHLDMIKTAEKVVLKSPYNNKNFEFPNGPWKLLEDPNLLSEEDLFKIFVTEYCNNLRDLLIEKNKSYGNSALDPVRVFSSADSLEQIKVRIDDKLSRIQRGNNSFNEDTIQDLQGYLILLQYKLKQ